MKHGCCILGLSLLTLIAFALPARADLLHGVGLIGDGTNASSEYDAPPVIMHTLRGLNFGTNYAYDYGFPDTTSESILQPGNSVSMLAAQAQAGNVTLAFYSVGDNDLLPAVSAVANGTLSGPALAAQQALLVNNIKTGVNTLLATGVKVVLGGVSNVANSPAFAPILANPVAKARVENATAQIEAQLSAFANEKHIGFVDFAGLEKAVFDSGHFSVGGVNINLHTTGSDPHNFFQDGINAGVIIRAEIANLWMQGANQAYGANIPLLTDQEVLTYAGIGNEYVDETFLQAMPLAQFVTSVPEPSSVILIGLGLCGLPVVARHARRKRSV